MVDSMPYYLLMENERKPRSLTQAVLRSGMKFFSCECHALCCLSYSLLIMNDYVADYSDAYQFSVLKLDIYARRILGKDTHIGGISELIAGLCPPILTSGKYTQVQSLLDVTMAISEETPARVEFRLAIVVDRQRAESADIRRDAEVALVNMHPLAKGASTSALGLVKDFVDNWTPLLRKVKLFCDLVDVLAEVRLGRTHSDGGILILNLLLG